MKIVPGWLMGVFAVACVVSAAGQARPAGRPNIILILADDLGFSDLGCYGSEIATPNLDRLAAAGLRFTQFYNAARCCPTRAALLTGVYPHQAGVGHMTRDRGLPGYRGSLSERCVTVAEVLRAAGYHCLMSGKWHLGEVRPQQPIDRGFEHYFGLLGGACSYFRLWPGRRMGLDDRPFVPKGDDFYMTDAITERAVGHVEEYSRKNEPFFLYVAYTAPHAPLHARPEDIARYRGKYRVGWDISRQRRHQRMIELGILDPDVRLSPRDAGAAAWEDVKDKEREDLKMAVYAAQVDRMDRGIGRILEKVRERGIEKNTLVLFLSDNGGDSEDIDESKPGALPGEPDSNLGYALPWANLSNVPFRRFKRQVHEGGIATPLIVYWPAVIRSGGRIVKQVGHVIDLLPTCLDAAGAAYPETHAGHTLMPVEGTSLLPVMRGEQRAGHEYLFWEHEGNRAVRQGAWKLVAVHGGTWELYNLEADRTELDDCAVRYPEKVKSLASAYQQWARRCGVVGWDELQPLPRRGNGQP